MAYVVQPDYHITLDVFKNASGWPDAVRLKRRMARPARRVNQTARAPAATTTRTRAPCHPGEPSSPPG
ncbi:hypothetical protein EAS64_33485 [Trebonia kvetii]|uniref:Uncharacterized protein n=1 Tax=Trebonia kvetii TaxID=2480626 RepID=A0A6P2BQR8_9ACTN|nr:hypothetical protein [Trebonia kvetii]TVZ01198.1 hypothetical protein EAS64_33485 [Trebonia kvetii]